jgi:hypothetical protein
VVLAGGTHFVSFKACSGATTADTLALLPTVPQPNVKVMTLTMGFNDTLWTAAVDALLAGNLMADQAYLSQTATEISGPVAVQIQRLISALRTAYPKATIYWGGYVQQFGPGEDPAGTCVVRYGNPYDPSIAYVPNVLAGSLDGLVVSMNGVLQERIAAASAGGASITNVNADVQFTGQRACNNPTPAVFNLHPTVAGQLLYARAFKDAGAGK